MKQCLSRVRCKEYVGEARAHSLSPSVSVDLPISADAWELVCALSATFSRARGGGRSPDRGHPNLRYVELGPTGREALTHLFGVPREVDRHESDIRRTPPFTRTGVVNGYAPSPILGVVLKFVTSTGLASTDTA